MTVSEQIIQVIDVLCTKFGVVIDWTGENVIPYLTTLLSKLVLWEICSSVAWITIFVILTLASIIGIKKLTPVFKAGLERDKRSYGCGWEVGSIFAIIGLCMFYIVTIFVIVTQIMDIIECCTFPEMYVFKYVQNFINAG